MRPVLLVFILSILTVEAAPQFSQSECQKLNEERLQLQKQLRQPYTQQQGKQLQARQQELLRLLQRHCRQPKKDDLAEEKARVLPLP